MRLDRFILLVLALWLICLLMLTSCKCPCAALPDTGTHDHNRDSVRTEYVHDSIFTDRWHNKQVHDSIYIQNTDTIYKTVEIIKQGSKFLRNSGVALWIIIALAIAAAVIGIIIHFAK